MIQPSKSPLYYPTMNSQSASMLGIAFRENRLNVSLARLVSNPLSVICSVSLKPLRTKTWSASPALYRRYRVKKVNRFLRIVKVRTSELKRQRHALRVGNQMALAARLGFISGIGTSLVPPKTARTEEESITARDQSILPVLQSPSSRKRRIFSQIPASCQSRRRRQQVIPQPQPISCGSISQGMPLRKTKTIPLSAFLSGTGGRPPLGFGFSGGSSGRITSHSSSVTSSFAIGMPPSYCWTCSISAFSSPNLRFC